MTKLELMQKANTFYPDGQLAEYFNPETGEFFDNPQGGDSLARFIACEIAETFAEVPVGGDFSDSDQLDQAKRVLHTALGDILSVLAGLDGVVVWRGLKAEEGG